MQSHSIGDQSDKGLTLKTSMSAGFLYPENVKWATGLVNTG